MSRSIHETGSDYRIAARNGDDKDRVLEALRTKTAIRRRVSRDRQLESVASTHDVATTTLNASLRELADDKSRASLERAHRRIQAGHVDYDTLYNVAVWTEQLGDEAEALELYGRAIKHVLVDGGTAHDVDAWFNRGLLLRKLRRHAEANADFRWIVENAKDSDDVDAAEAQLQRAVP